MRQFASNLVASFTLRHVGFLIVMLKFILILYIVLRLTVFSNDGFSLSFDRELLFFLFAGFVAQLIDGALGMAYGVSCSTLLISFGITPAVASASVHTAEVFTTGVSGLSHIFMKNVNRKLFLRIAVTGAIGAMLGAYLLSKVFNGSFIKPYVSVYLLIMGVILLVKSFKNEERKRKFTKLPLLGFTGGLLDAMGGGGWGPIVTSNLIMKKGTPKETIGTVNTAEFFVTFFSTGVFLFFLGIDSWKVILGLIAGGVIAAPLGAFLIGKIKPKIIMISVGIVIIISSLITIYNSLF